MRGEFSLIFLLASIDLLSTHHTVDEAKDLNKKAAQTREMKQNRRKFIFSQD